MKLNPLNLQTNPGCPFRWVKNFFEASSSVAFQILSLRDWTEYNGETDGQFKENDKHNVPRTATKLREFLQVVESEELLQSVSQASGKEIELFDLSFQNFIINDYLVGDVNQDIRLTLFLSDHWQRDWGGVTEFKIDQIWGAVAIPTFGAALLQLPDFKWLSRVTKIAPEAPVSRISTVLRFREKS